MMKPILDATAGNRAMWKNKNPPNVVFMDRETRLALPPDIFCVWQHLPFRDNSFETVLFDPPHDKFSPSSVHMDPKGWYNNRIENGRKSGGTFWDSLERGWAGIFYSAQKEFSRISNRLCLKWNNSRHPLETVLMLFEDWVEILRKEHRSNMRRGKTQTWWVTMIKQTTEALN